MTLTEIYNIALRQHGKLCTEAEVTSANPPYEVRLCTSGYNSAVHRVLGEFNWSHFTVPVIYQELYDFPKGKWVHGYLLPQGILRIVPRSTQPYDLIGNVFLTNEERPDIFAIMDNFDCESAPDNFCELVGLALAYDLCGIIAPADNAILSMILQKYSWTLQTMISADCPAEKRALEEGGALEEDTFGFRPRGR